jgi:hypothetical protein
MSTNLKEARLPLLMTDETDVASDPRDDQKAFQRYALSLGLMVGTFMQLSTLGANFLVHSLCSATTLHTTMGKIGLPLLYSAVTSTMALIVLALIRNVVSISYYQESRSKKAEDVALQDLLRKLEGSFVVGALSGVCMAWVTTDLIFAQRQLTVVPIMLTMKYYIFFYFYHSSNNPDNPDNNDNNNHEAEQAAEGLFIRSSGGYRNAMVV